MIWAVAIAGGLFVGMLLLPDSQASGTTAASMLLLPALNQMIDIT